VFTLVPICFVAPDGSRRAQRLDGGRRLKASASRRSRRRARRRLRNSRPSPRMSFGIPARHWRSGRRARISKWYRTCWATNQPRWRSTGMATSIPTIWTLSRSVWMKGRAKLRTDCGPQPPRDL